MAYVQLADEAAGTPGLWAVYIWREPSVELISVKFVGVSGVH